MKRILNPLYLVAALLLASLFFYQNQTQQEQEQFFGFAENLQTEINLDFPVQVNSLLVDEGDAVEKGESLLDLSQLELSKDIQDDGLLISTLNAQHQSRINDLQAEMLIYQGELTEKRNKLLAEISDLEEELTSYMDLKQDLSTLSLQEDTSRLQFLNKEIEKRKEGISDVERIYQARLDGLKQAKKDEEKKYRSLIDKQGSDVTYKEAKLKKLSLSAPSVAVVGNIHVKEGEYVGAFETMVTLYEPQPTQVKGFVTEGTKLNVKEGDKFIVRSVQHVEKTVQGVVTGLGARIVEIPERLRQIPTIKIYGREILISIPSENVFLNGEKVLITLDN